MTQWCSHPYFLMALLCCTPTQRFTASFEKAPITDNACAQSPLLTHGRNQEAVWVNLEPRMVQPFDSFQGSKTPLGELGKNPLIAPQRNHYRGICNSALVEGVQRSTLFRSILLLGEHGREGHLEKSDVNPMRPVAEREVPQI